MVREGYVEVPMALLDAMAAQAEATGEYVAAVGRMDVAEIRAAGAALAVAMNAVSDVMANE